MCLAAVALWSAPLRAENDAGDTFIPKGSLADNLPKDNGIVRDRKTLADRGVSYNFIYTHDVLSNLHGGIKRGTIDQGKLEGQLTLDLDKLAGWKDFTLYANAFEIHNTGRLRRDYVGSMNTIAAIEANSTVRLSELWLERKLGEIATLRFGQLAADSEFFFSDYSYMFLQSDWPTIGAVNLPGGGPAYPLSAVGARLRVEPDKRTVFMFAVFNGDPAGPCPGDPDTCNRYGTNFRVRDPALMISEFQFKTNHGSHDAGLAQTIKIGAWGHLGQFNDPRLDNTGRLLADPATSGVPAQHRGDWGIYGIIDQQIYRLPSGSRDSGVAVYARASLSPSDRNLVDAYIDGGLVFIGMLPQRPEDRFGVGFIYARFSDSVRAFDQDAINFGGTGFVRDYELNVELNYTAQIAKGWVVQPLFTWIFHPNGNASRDAQVGGVRSIWKF